MLIFQHFSSSIQRQVFKFVLQQQKIVNSSEIKTFSIKKGIEVFCAITLIWWWWHGNLIIKSWKRNFYLFLNSFIFFIRALTTDAKAQIHQFTTIFCWHKFTLSIQVTQIPFYTISFLFVLLICCLLTRMKEICDHNEIFSKKKKTEQTSYKKANNKHKNIMIFFQKKQQKKRRKMD